MFFSFALILLSGLFLGWVCRRLGLPSLLGMLAAGILIGPYALNLIDPKILAISAELRKIALIIILMRAGLSLDFSKLKKNGLPAVLMCFVPACFEILGMVLLAPPILGISRLEAAIMGAVVGAVSPAVIVPKMLKLTEEGYGTEQGIPQMILAGASVDDVFVIVMFSAFTAFAKTGTVSPGSFFKIPVSILLGILAGLFAGALLGRWFQKISVRDTAKMILMMSAAFLLTAFEDGYGERIPFSAMIAVMCMGLSMQKISPERTERLSVRYSKLWVLSEIVLFVLVGACVNLEYVKKAGAEAVILIFAVLLFRMMGVFFCLVKTTLSKKERLFCMIAYLPKATVQAAIGGLPIAMGLSCGEIVLTVAVLSIVITAPLGAFLIDCSYQKLLDHKQ